MSKTILGALAVLAVLVVVYALFRPKEYTSSREGEGSAAFEAFRDVDVSKVAKVSIAKGDGPAVELQKAGETWVVASSYGYPADAERVEKLIASLDKIDKADYRGRSADASVAEEYELDTQKGSRITLFDAGGAQLGSLTVGKTVPGGGFSTTRVFARFGDDGTTYAIESDVRSEASLYGEKVEGKSFLQKKVFALPETDEVVSVRVSRPDKPDVLVERKQREVPVEAPKEPDAPVEGDGAAEPAEPPKPETKKEEYFVVTSGSDTTEVGKSEEWKARGLINKGKDVTIADAVEPKELSAYGLDAPQLKAIVTYRKKDAPDAELKTLTVSIGNEKKDEKGETSGYYLALDDAASKDRIYLLEKYNFDGWAKEYKDFLPAPKEEPKAEPAPPPGDSADGTPAPTGVPGDAGDAAPGDAAPGGDAPGGDAPGDAPTPGDGSAAPGAAPPAGEAPPAPAAPAPGGEPKQP